MHPLNDDEVAYSCLVSFSSLANFLQKKRIKMETWFNFFLKTYLKKSKLVSTLPALICSLFKNLLYHRPEKFGVIDILL